MFPVAQGKGYVGRNRKRAACVQHAAPSLSPEPYYQRGSRRRLPPPPEPPLPPRPRPPPPPNPPPPSGFGSCLVDRQRAAAEIVLVELRNRLLRFLVGSHLDKREAARASGGHIAHDAHGLHIAGLTEQLLQLGFADCVGEIADVQLATLLWTAPGLCSRLTPAGARATRPQSEKGSLG